MRDADISACHDDKPCDAANMKRYIITFRHILRQEPRHQSLYRLMPGRPLLRYNIYFVNIIGKAAYFGRGRRRIPGPILPDYACLMLLLKKQRATMPRATMLATTLADKRAPYDATLRALCAYFDASGRAQPFIIYASSSLLMLIYHDFRHAVGLNDAADGAMLAHAGRARCL